MPIRVERLGVLAIEDVVGMTRVLALVGIASEPLGLLPSLTLVYRLTSFFCTLIESLPGSGSAHDDKWAAGVDDAVTSATTDTQLHSLSSR